MKVPFSEWVRLSGPFLSYLDRQGAEMRPVGQDELLHFIAPFQKKVGVVYRNSRGYATLCMAAESAWDDFRANVGWRLAAPAPKIQAKSKAALIQALLLRDGDTCCFCGQPLVGEQSLEHGLDRSNGGTDHLSNLMLAHAKCNSNAGNVKNLRAKIEYIVALRSAQGADLQPKEI